MISSRSGPLVRGVIHKPLEFDKMVDLKSLHPQLDKSFTETASGSTVCSYTSDIGGDGPILTLIHGYPQSAFM